MLMPCPYQKTHWDLTQLRDFPLLLSLDISIVITKWKNVCIMNIWHKLPTAKVQNTALYEDFF